MAEALMPDAAAVERADARVRPAPLYEKLLGANLAQLAAPIRRLHSADPQVFAHGRLRVARAAAVRARLIAWALRLPPANDAASATLAIVANADGERWLRRFERRRLDTRQFVDGAVLVERFGLLELRFAVEPCAGGLAFRQLGASLRAGSFRLPLPRACAPVVDARERPAGDECVAVDVRVTMPWAGMVLSYRGEMRIEVRP
jgi:Domain of unknown function (DUF4166)